MPAEAFVETIQADPRLALAAENQNVQKWRRAYLIARWDFTDCVGANACARNCDAQSRTLERRVAGWKRSEVALERDRRGKQRQGR